MGWMETCPVEERMKFVLAVEAGEESFSAICRRFGVSRRVGLKWRDRYRLEGVEGLNDRSRRPLSHPQAISQETAQACLAVRRCHPTWGPLKVKAWLERHMGESSWPAASTIGDLFDREGLTVKRRLRRRGPPSTAPFDGCDRPNDLWCIDWKGWFLTGDGAHCEPLTLCDGASRYLFRCQALARSDGEHAWPVLDATMREYGRPWRLRSDNGPPFASRGAGGLSRLAVKLIKAGVTPERIEPGKPQQNGRLERLHLTLLQDTASPPARSLREQIARLERFRRTYNEERPHEALGNATPADLYVPSERSWDGVLREPDYGGQAEVRRVRTKGEIKWRGELVYISEALIREPVGLFEADDGWRVWYGPVFLGVIDPRKSRLVRPKRRHRQAVDNPRGFPTASTTTTAKGTTNEVNETGNLSPMSPV